MPNTFELIASSTVGAGGAVSIDFTSIPSTYTDLCLKFSARTNYTTDWDDGYITFNSNTSSYSYKVAFGVGTSALSGGASSRWSGWNTAQTPTANTFASNEIYIPNYAGSANKSFSIETAVENNSATTNILGFAAGLWSNTSAITSISLSSSHGASYSFIQYSTAYLYGVKNA